MADFWPSPVDAPRGCAESRTFRSSELEESLMILLHPWVLILLLLPVALLFWQWNRAPRRLNLLLKALMLAAAIFALSEPEVTISENKVSAVVLVDTSAGLTSEDLGQVSDLVSRIDRAHGRNSLRVIPFARASRSLSKDEYGRQWKIRRTAGD